MLRGSRLYFPVASVGAVVSGLLVYETAKDRSTAAAETAKPSNVATPAVGAAQLAASVVEPSLWQRLQSYLSFTPKAVDVPLPIDKLSCKRVDGRPADVSYRPVVLLSCGSFNPPTVMHLRMFELAAHALGQAGYDVLGAYMSPVNDRYRKSGLAPAVHRVRMCQLAADTCPLVMVDSWEAQQRQYCRTLTVLRRVEGALREAMEGGGGGETAKGDGALACGVCLLGGADLAESMVTPGVWLPEQLEEVLGKYGMVVVSREGSRLQELLDDPGSVLHRYRHNIRIVEEPIPNQISSTLVRQQLGQGAPVRYLLPDPVIHYIREQRLYGAKL